MLSALRHLFRLAGGSGHPAAADPMRAADAIPGAEGPAPAAPATGLRAGASDTGAAGATFRPTDFTFVGPGGSRHLPAAELHDLAERAAALFRTTLTGRRIGLVFRSEPSLVVAWLGLVAAGFEPLILQYPTEKQNRAVWTGSIANSIQVAALDRILCAPRRRRAARRPRGRPPPSPSPSTTSPHAPRTSPSRSARTRSSSCPRARPATARRSPSAAARSPATCTTTTPRSASARATCASPGCRSTTTWASWPAS